MVASRGEDTSLWSVPLGFFPPASPLACDAGLSVLTGKRDDAAVARALQSAGYQGEKMVLLAMTNSPYSGPASNVTADVLKRRELSKPPAQGGWNCTAPAFPASLALHLQPTWHCWATAPAGQTIRRCRNCERRGSTRQTSPSG